MSNIAIVRFFKEEGYGVLLGHLGVSIVFTGIASIALLGIINEVAFNDREATHDLMFYGIAILVFALGTRFLNIRVTRLVERQLFHLRMRIMEGVKASELTRIERLGRENIHVALAQDVALVSNSADMLISAVQQCVMLLFCLVYVAILSPIAFGIVVGSIITTYFLISRLQRILQKNYERLADEENKLFVAMDHLVNGFKEVKINHKKGQAIAADYAAYLQETERLKVDNRIRSSWTILASHLFMYSLLGAIVFTLPSFTGNVDGLIGKLVATILFIITPLLLILEGIPTIERANSSLHRLYELDELLAHELPVSDVDSKAIPEFQQLMLKDVRYRYPIDSAALSESSQSDQSNFSSAPIASDGFAVGPLDCVIERGEIVFITGGNGSGKSTLLKLLTGLYVHQQGQILLNQKAVNASSIHHLRNQFAVVFTDFHLFDKFYGLEVVDEVQVGQLIEDMELSGKVHFANGRFSTTRLSTGQRKRLALIMAILDNRNIYVFDEWAADQDTHFRDRFYKTILPALKIQGKTVIAVTHDDRYWECCDRLLKVDLGVVHELPLYSEFSVHPVKTQASGSSKRMDEANKSVNEDSQNIGAESVVSESLA